MAHSFSNGNLESTHSIKKVSFRGGDYKHDARHNLDVGKQEPDWHLQDWMRYRGKRQADLVKDLGWAKGRANKFFHGLHPYRREIVNELSAWLEIEPFELLLPPEDAIRLRRLRDAALAISGLLNQPV